MNTYRLRVEQPLRIDAHDDVADAIIGLGGVVVSVDLREVEGAAVVDEIVVSMPSDVDRRGLRAALEESTGTVMLSSQHCDHEAPAAQARRWMREMDNDRRQGPDDLAGRLSAACPKSSVWICDRDEADSLPVVQMALERRSPVVDLATTLPVNLHDASRSRGWLLAAPDRYPDARTVALLARPTSLRFAASEVARVQLLMAS